MKRRDFLAAASLTTAAGLSLGASAALPTGKPAEKPPTDPADRPGAGGRIRSSICRWCYNNIPLEDLCAMSKRLGVESIELLSEADWPIVARHGLACAVANGPVSINKGLNRTDGHDDFVKECTRLLPLVKAAEIPNLIVFSGNRKGQSDEEGLANCAAALKRVTPIAEDAGVTIIMELLNSKVDHGDYQCDRTPWGVQLVQRVGSPRFKLLYDIYHMQIMEGDVIRTLTKNLPHIAHLHTGGVPGRAEIDQSQELNYTAICKAAAGAGYTGYLGQEFIPRHDPETSLREALRICRV